MQRSYPKVTGKRAVGQQDGDVVMAHTAHNFLHQTHGLTAARTVFTRGRWGVKIKKPAHGLGSQENEPIQHGLSSAASSRVSMESAGKGQRYL